MHHYHGWHSTSTLNVYKQIHKLILKQGVKKSENDYEYNDREGGFKDDYEKLEWEDYYESREEEKKTGRARNYFY